MKGIKYATYEPVVISPEDIGGLYDIDSVYNSPYLNDIYEMTGMGDAEISGVKLNEKSSKERDISAEELDPFKNTAPKTKKGSRFGYSSSDINVSKTEEERLKAFNEAYDAYEKINPEAKKNRKFLTKVAFNESRFISDSKNPNAPAYGLFQFMQDGKRYNNITAYSGVGINEFLSNPMLQIASANKMIADIDRQLNDSDLKRLKELGLTRNAAYGMAWLGGVGGMRNFIHKGINASDSHWYKGENKGVDMREQIKRYNF